jgi:hypothetical protein
MWCIYIPQVLFSSPLRVYDSPRVQEDSDMKPLSSIVTSRACKSVPEINP